MNKTKLKIRLVRGTLAESMETAVEIDATLEAVAKHLKDQYGFGDISKDTINVTAYAFDKRNSWGDTYIVYGSNGAALAFTNGPVKG